jgi:hypothetical protein
MKSSMRIATYVLFCLSTQFLAACGGGGADGTSLQAAASPIVDKGPVNASFSQESPIFAPGEAVEIVLENVTPGEATAVISPVTDDTGTGGTGTGDTGTGDTGSGGTGTDTGTGDTGLGSTGTDGSESGGTPVTIDQPGTNEGVVILPTDLPPGRYTLTLHVRGKELVLYFDVSPTSASQDARQSINDLIQQALAQLDAYLTNNVGDVAAAALRDRLAALATSLASASPEDLAAWQQQFAANDLPSLDVPASCSAATAQYKVRVRKMLNTARLASWLSARNVDAPSHASEVAALLAHARMEEAMRRLLAYAEAVRQVCGGQADLDTDTERARQGRDRAAAARG